MRTTLFWAAAIYVLGGFGLMIMQKETLRQDGDIVYLALAPLDPRSPFQGDYMALNYQVANAMNHLPAGSVPAAGAAVIALDQTSTGRFVRIFHGEGLAANEHLLKFHHDGWRVVIGAERFFIPEGSGARFAKATCGKLRVGADGTPLLVALCDKDQKPITDATLAGIAEK